MLRPLIAALVNLILLLTLAVRAPFHLFGRRRAPVYVRFLLKGDPPYRQPLQRRWPLRRERHAPGQVTSLHLLDEALEALGADPAVKGVVLQVESLQMPAGKRAWIAERLAAFRARGKEVVGTAVSAGNAELALLCAADRIALPRAGRLELAGFLAEATAAGRAFEQLGIRPEFVRRGEHKTAPELFTRAEVSPNQRAALEQFLDERHDELVDAVARGRRLSVDEARARVDQGPYSATRAQALGLVDLIADDLELPTALGLEPDEDRALAGTAGIGTLRDWERSRRVPRVRWMAWRRPTRLAVVPVSGMIAHSASGAPPLGPSIAGSETLVAGLRAAARDRTSPAAVLYVNSPGGSALASELVLAEVRRLAARKPVIAYVDRVAASGGYMVALGAKEIWASPGSILGSIGVFAGKFDLSQLLSRLGVHREVLTRGEHAGLLTSARPMSAQEREALEAEVEEIYGRFVELVAEHRRLGADAVRARGEGRVYTAARAREAGLVDTLGSFEDACARALALAGRAPRRFELHPFGLPRRRLPLLSLLRNALAPAVYALWWPAWTAPGLRGSEDFGMDGG
ncbi:MAG TPA: signal peptide peptidase SppA [Myxococcaceae bacterium]|nr:signal peptide peptidase SppA [Myxococcaceae bacterium]